MANDLTVKRHLSLSPSECFALWSDAERLSKWWGPKDEAGKPFISVVQSWSVTPGSKWTIKMVAPDGTEFWQGGEVLEVTPPASAAVQLPLDRERSARTDD